MEEMMPYYTHNVHVFIILYYTIQSTGWPGVVAVMGNWFGKKNRGLFLGIWNAHTSLGNILGTAIPSIWASPGEQWYVLEVATLGGGGGG